VIRDSFLYTCHHVGLSGTNGPSGGTNVDRTAVQWFKLQISTNDEPLTVWEHGRIYDSAATNAVWHYLPSMMVNCAGDMAFGFSGSGDTNYISAYYAWRPASGSIPTTSRLLQPGLGYYVLDRWGDYSCTSLDPTDGMTFWTVQEFLLETTNTWGTTIGKIKRDP
jgi:hypothetical protein